MLFIFFIPQINTFFAQLKQNDKGLILFKEGNYYLAIDYLEKNMVKQNNQYKADALFIIANSHLKLFELYNYGFYITSNVAKDYYEILASDLNYKNISLINFYYYQSLCALNLNKEALEYLKKNENFNDKELKKIIKVYELVNNYHLGDASKLEKHYSELSNSNDMNIIIELLYNYILLGEEEKIQQLKNKISFDRLKGISNEKLMIIASYFERPDLATEIFKNYRWGIPNKIDKTKNLREIHFYNLEEIRALSLYHLYRSEDIVNELVANDNSKKYSKWISENLSRINFYKKNFSKVKQIYKENSNNQICEMFLLLSDPKGLNKQKINNFASKIKESLTISEFGFLLLYFNLDFNAGKNFLQENFNKIKKNNEVSYEIIRWYGILKLLEKNYKEAEIILDKIYSRTNLNSFRSNEPLTTLVYLYSFFYNGFRANGAEVLHSIRPLYTLYPAFNHLFYLFQGINAHVNSY